jgi:glycosyltransferase involved in cell wall biosynthesis
MKICFWGEIAGALNGNPLGGGEKQIALLAKALVKAGHEVIYVDYTVQNDYSTDEGIKVYGIRGYEDGIKGLRNLTSRLRLIYKSLKDKKADIYYCRIRDFRHILAYWAARTVKAKFVFGTAADLDLLGLKERLKYLYFTDVRSLWWFTNGFLSEIVYPFLLRKSDLVLVQHEGQKKILSGNNIKSTVFPNLIDITDGVLLSCSDSKDYVYVGALDKRKGFDILFDLIERTPDQSYKIIGEPRDKIASYLFDKLKSFRNVKLLGKLSHSDTYSQIASSKALISTSPREGFPNIFLEAWSVGIPVLSLYVDPGNVIKDKNLGIAADGNMETIIKYMEGPGVTNEFCERAKKYVEENHVLNERKVIEISDLFNNLINRGSV